MRIDGHQCALRLRQPVLIRLKGRQHLHRGFRGPLHIHVDCRINFQPALINSVCAVLVDQSLHHIINEIRGLRVLPRCRAGKLQIFPLQATCFGIADIMVFRHLLQHRRPTRACRFQIVERRIIIRALRDARQHRALVQRKRTDVLAEIRLRSSLDAVRALPEINLVQIKLQDFLLRILTLKLQRKEHFLYLALHRALRRQIRVLRQLLRDR